MIEYWWHIALLAIVFWAAKVCIYRTQTKLLVVNGANQDEEDANKVIIPSTNVSTEETVFDLKKPDKRIPVSVNFHFTRKCNYECGFCFHTAKTSHITPLEDAKRGRSGRLSSYRISTTYHRTSLINLFMYVSLQV